MKQQIHDVLISCGIGEVNAACATVVLLELFDITPKVVATPEQQEVMRGRLG